MLLQLACQWVRKSIRWAPAFLTVCTCVESVTQHVAAKAPFLGGPGLRAKQPIHHSRRFEVWKKVLFHTLHLTLKVCCTACSIQCPQTCCSTHLWKCLLERNLCRTGTCYMLHVRVQVPMHDVLSMTELHRVTLVSCVRQGSTAGAKMPQC